MPDPKCWPAWRYGPGGAAAIFAAPEDVPSGWVDSPAKVVEPAKPEPPKKPRKG